MNLEELLGKFVHVDWLEVEFDITGSYCLYCMKIDDVSKFYERKVLNWSVYLDAFNDLTVSVILKSESFLDVINNSIG